MTHRVAISNAVLVLPADMDLIEITTGHDQQPVFTVQAPAHWCRGSEGCFLAGHCGNNHKEAA